MNIEKKKEKKEKKKLLERVLFVLLGKARQETCEFKPGMLFMSYTCM